MSDVAQNFITDQMAVLVIDALEMVQIANGHDSCKWLAALDTPFERGLVQQAGQTIQIQVPQAVPAHCVNFIRKSVDAIALALDQHGHCGKRQQHQQRENKIAVVAEIERPLRPSTLVVDVEKRRGVEQECNRKADERELEKPAADTEASTNHEEGVEIDAAQHQSVHRLESLEVALKSQQIHDGQKEWKTKQHTQC